MRWHLRAAWDALFIPHGWIALAGYWIAGAAGWYFSIPDVFWVGGIGGVALLLYAWWLQYSLICQFRPIAEHYEREAARAEADRP